MKGARDQALKRLRKRAELAIERRSARQRKSRESRDVDHLVQELEVHHVELEMQNDELRSTQDSLAESLDRYFELYDLAPVGYLTLDASGKILEANVAAAELFGLEASKLVGLYLSSFLAEIAADTLYFHLQDVFKGTERVSCELALADGGESGEAGAPLRMDSVAVRDADGNRTRCRSVVIDLSELRRAQAELSQMQKIEALGALATGVAHDFGNVIYSILGCLRLARAEGATEEEVEEHLKSAAEAARRGGDLVDRLMAFAYKKQARPRPLELDGVVRSAAPLIERLLPDDVDLAVETGAPGREVVADANQIDQMLMNLAVNARDAMPDGGRLSIRTDFVELDRSSAPRPDRQTRGKKAAFVRLVVTDSGVGMDDSTREHVFEPFFTTKERGKGTGLGLSTVYAFMRRMGGRVEVESEPGKGTVFELYFPAVETSVT